MYHNVPLPSSLSRLSSQIRVAENTFERAIVDLKRRYEETSSRSDDILGALGVRISGSFIITNEAVFKMYDISDLTHIGISLHDLISRLYSDEKLMPFKIIQSASLSRDSLADHMKWVRSQYDNSLSGLSTGMPNASIEFPKFWKDVYEETAAHIGNRRRSFRTYVVAQCDPNGDTVFDRYFSESLKPVNEGGLMRWLLQAYDLLGSDNTSPWEDYVLRAAKYGNANDGMSYVAPDELCFSAKQAETSRNARHCHYASLRIYGGCYGENTQIIRNAITSCIQSDSPDMFTLSLTANPIKHFLNYFKNTVTARMLQRIPREKRANEQPLKKRLFLEQVNKTLESLTTELPVFEVSMTLCIRTDTKERLEEILKVLQLKLAEKSIWFEKPSMRSDMEDALMSLSPAVFPYELDDDITEPVGGIDLENSIRYGKIVSAVKGVLVGYTVPEFKELVLPLGVYASSGQNGSGKSFMFKVLAFMSLLLNPDHKVYVMDNAGAAAMNGYMDKIAREERLKGWIDICKMVGGKVVFSQDYTDDKKLYAALCAAGDTPFTLYYPDPNKMSNDVTYLNWLYQAMSTNFDARSATEKDIRGIAIFDDVASLFGLPSGRTLVLQTLTECVAHGFIAGLTVQSLAAIEKSDPASYLQLINTVNTHFLFPSPGYASIPDSIGIVPITEELRRLQIGVIEAQQALNTFSLGSEIPKENLGLCVGVNQNKTMFMAFIYAVPELIALLSRKTP